ncbi:MAG TPA: LppX_LprAFG lipoprotein, partial [Ktedonobacterales bacterium]|nr:LppX_LprAFG lipoprotein [Ktedonobacterales bacterium]
VSRFDGLRMRGDNGRAGVARRTWCAECVAGKGEADNIMKRQPNRSRRASVRDMRWTATLGLAILLTVFALAGCSGPSVPTPASLLKQAQQHFNDAKTFHFVMTADHLGPKPEGDPGLSSLSAAEGDVQRPDRLSSSGTVDLGGLTVSTKLVIIGQQAWYLNPLSGSWEEDDSFASFVTLFDPAKGIGVALTSLRNPTLPSDGSANGTPCWKISGDLDTAALGALLGDAATPAKAPHITICIGKSDGRLYSVVLAGQIVAGDIDQTTRTIYLSKYDAPVNIQPPV